MKKRIFGKTYEFHCDGEYTAMLAESLELYPDNDSVESDVNVSISSRLSSEPVTMVNPANFKKTACGMIISYGGVEVFWAKGAVGTLDVQVAIRSKNPIRRIVNRIRSIEYSTEVEIFEQVLYELVLIPSVYFFGDLAPVHSACVSYKNQALLFAGAGGCGKSSALLALKDSSEAGFVSDDMSVLSKDGKVYGNMAWPKVYGYNCLGNDVESVVLRNRGIVDRLHFKIKKRINPRKVRRKVSPGVLYDSVAPGATSVSRLYYLVKERVSEVGISRISLDDAVNMTVSAMCAEYSIFHNFIYWDEFNSAAGQQNPLLTMSVLKERWRRVLRAALAHTSTYKVSLPFGMDHRSYQDYVVQVLSASAETRGDAIDD